MAGPADQPDARRFEREGRPALAYRLRQGAGPTLVFLPGYASDMDGGKAVALDALAERTGLSMLRFDYRGTGLSEGRFEDGTLDQWLDDSLAVVDALTDGPVIVIGSSMGGWIALHLALARPARVAGLVGIAAAPDFTDWGYGPDDRRTLDRDGRLERPSAYGGPPQLTTRGFWQSGQQLRLLDRDIAVSCPVRLIHGDRDGDVPVDVALRLMDRLESDDVQLTLVKNGGHRLSEPTELAAIGALVGRLADEVQRV